MQTYLFIGGGNDGLDVTVAHDLESAEMLVGVTGRETYFRDKPAVGDASIAIYRDESLTSPQVLKLFVKHYQTWCVNKPGGRPQKMKGRDMVLNLGH